MNIIQHWLQEAVVQKSPNFDERPDEQDVSLIVIHCISLPPKQFGGSFIDQLFCNQLNPQDHPYFRQIHQLQVSAHILVDRKGKITQYVPFNKRAWHAGNSKYRNRENCNDFSIGIELEGTEEIPYTDVQYQRLAAITTALIAHYPALSEQHIIGHCDIAPGRKTDPGDSFGWKKYRRMLDNQLKR